MKYLAPWFERPFLCLLGLHKMKSHPCGHQGHMYCTRCGGERIPA